jgi:hypothetical protein
MEQAKALIGVEGFLGAWALYEFIKSLVVRPTHVVHGHAIRGTVSPSWGWLCVLAVVALFAEMTVVHRLLREREGASGTGKISVKDHAAAMAEMAHLMKEPKT